MTTKEKLILDFKAQNPTIRVGSDEIGYTELNATEYETTIEQWADNFIANELLEAEKQAAKEVAQTKLAALGLTTEDLKALGL